MRHPHADMIIAKAENMDLVVLAKHNEKWITLCDFPYWEDDCEYFLCLPKNKEACLHWLNGGDVQLSNKGDFYNVSSVSLRCVNGWSLGCAFMDDSRDIRIKPRKEKRWIVAKPNSLASMFYFHTEKDAQHAVDSSTGEFRGGQVIEIEVEV